MSASLERQALTPHVRPSSTTVITVMTKPAENDMPIVRTERPLRLA